MTPFDKPVYVTAPLLPPLEAVTARLADVWASGWLTNNGRQQELLESALRAYLGVPQLSLFNNGTIALFTALRALDLRGEVIDAVYVPRDAACARLERRDAGLCGHRPREAHASIPPASKRPSRRGPRVSSVRTYGIPCDLDGLQRWPIATGSR
jgi:hypothetical protein